MISTAVLIPAYNASAFIGEALESVARQVIQPQQVILIDDGSTDGTADVAKTAARRLDLAVEIIQQRNRGVSAARNAGLRTVRTVLVALLDADDFLLPDHLRLLTAAFERHPELIGCFGDQEVFDQTGITQKSFIAGKPITELAYDEEPDGLRLVRARLFSSLVRGNYVPTSSCVLSAATLRGIGEYNESLRTSEDQELLARLSLIGPFAYYPIVVARKRQHGGNLMESKATALAHDAVTAFLSIREAKLDLTAAERESLTAALNVSVDGLLYWASRDGLSAYFGARRWIARSSLFLRPIRAKDIARAAIAYSFGKNAKSR